MAAAVLLMVASTPANAAIVTTVPLGTSANYAVLGASTVTNTGDSTLHGSLGLWPGTSITGFPPGLVIPPGTTDTTNAAAQQAESDLTAAYVNAAGRPLNATTTADLANRNLTAGVYAGPSKSPLSLTGPLILNGAGNPRSVFIFQTCPSPPRSATEDSTCGRGQWPCPWSYGCRRSASAPPWWE
jgi:type VI secretion system secreted protein VgrG